LGGSRRDSVRRWPGSTTICLYDRNGLEVVFGFFLSGGEHEDWCCSQSPPANPPALKPRPRLFHRDRRGGFGDMTGGHGGQVRGCPAQIGDGLPNGSGAICQVFNGLRGGVPLFPAMSLFCPRSGMSDRWASQRFGGASPAEQRLAGLQWTLADVRPARGQWALHRHHPALPACLLGLRYDTKFPVPALQEALLDCNLSH